MLARISLPTKTAGLSSLGSKMRRQLEIVYRELVARSGYCVGELDRNRAAALQLTTG